MTDEVGVLYDQLASTPAGLASLALARFRYELRGMVFDRIKELGLTHITLRSQLPPGVGRMIWEMIHEDDPKLGELIKALAYLGLELDIKTQPVGTARAAAVAGL